MAENRVYGQFCPVSMGAEVFATKWTPLVLRELMCGEARFNDLLKGVPLMSRSLLSQRLQELEHSGLIEKEPTDSGHGHIYRLTPAGEELRPVITSLGNWAHKWLQHEIPEENLDPLLLMWDMRRNVDAVAYPPDRRTVVQFEYDGVPVKQRRFWLLVEHGEVELCLKPPAYDADLEVRCHIRVMTEIWLCRTTFGAEKSAKRLVLEGPKDLQKAFQSSLILNPFPRAV